MSVESAFWNLNSYSGMKYKLSFCFFVKVWDLLIVTVSKLKNCCWCVRVLSRHIILVHFSPGWFVFPVLFQYFGGILENISASCSKSSSFNFLMNNPVVTFSQRFWWEKEYFYFPPKENENKNLRKTVILILIMLKYLFELTYLLEIITWYFLRLDP